MSATVTWKDIVTGADARLAMRWFTDPTKATRMSLTGYSFELDMRPSGQPVAAIVRTLSTSNGGITITAEETVDCIVTLRINDEDAALPTGLYEGWLKLISGAEKIPQFKILFQVVA